MANNIAVYGIYRDRQMVEVAVVAIQNAGFRRTDISVLLPDNVGSKDFAHEKHTRAPEGAVAGGGFGAIVGGALGWLAGVGLLGIPWIGPFEAAGPILGTFAGVGVGGALGSIVGGLIGMGLPEYVAKRFEGGIKHGGILLSVHCDDSRWVKRAKQVLLSTGASKVSSAGEAHADFMVTDKPLLRPNNQGV